MRIPFEYQPPLTLGLDRGMWVRLEPRSCTRTLGCVVRINGNQVLVVNLLERVWVPLHKIAARLTMAEVAEAASCTANYVRRTTQALLSSYPA